MHCGQYTYDLIPMVKERHTNMCTNKQITGAYLPHPPTHAPPPHTHQWTWWMKNWITASKRCKIIFFLPIVQDQCLSDVCSLQHPQSAWQINRQYYILVFLSVWWVITKSYSSWFQPISTRRVLGKPVSCFSSLGESNWLCCLNRRYCYGAHGKHYHILLRHPYEIFLSEINRK